MPKPRPANVPQRAMVAVAATWVGGFVDTMGFLLLVQLLAGNMSGNTVRLALGAAGLNWVAVAYRGWPVLVFVGGLIVSAVVHEAGARRGMLRTSAIVFGAEAATLIGFAYIRAQPGFGSTPESPEAFLAATLLAFGMGLQNATMTRVGALSVKTTHVTGTLTQFAEGFSQFLFWFYDRIRAGFPGRARRVWRVARHQKSLQEAALMTALWIGFFAGAVFAAYMLKRFEPYISLPPLAVLMALIGMDIVRPIAGSAEHANRPRSGFKPQVKPQSAQRTQRTKGA